MKWLLALSLAFQLGPVSWGFQHCDTVMESVGYDECRVHQDEDGSHMWLVYFCSSYDPESGHWSDTEQFRVPYEWNNGRPRRLGPEPTIGCPENM